jgi:hypothetical protein
MLGMGLQLIVTAATAKPPPPSPLCGPLVRPDLLAAHSGQHWRPGSGIQLKGDTLACSYYQKDPPAGFSLSVRNDAQQNEFNAAIKTHERGLQSVSDLGDEAFFFRQASSEPFQPSWGLVVRAKKKTYRIEGVPEAGNADEARALARAIIERAMLRL